MPDSMLKLIRINPIKEELIVSYTLRNIIIITSLALISILVVVSFDSYLSNKAIKKEDIGYKIDWNIIDPLEFLNLLKKQPEKPLTIINYPPKEWIQEKHLKKLITLIDSQKPASVVVSAISSYFPFNQTSTVGNEAMFLIEGYRKGQYPPLLCSIYYFKPDPDEIKKWWNSK